jgi:GNAT superfamily N-acetyltransferase
MQLVPVETPGQVRAFCALPGPSTLTPDLLAMRQADVHYVVESEEGSHVARCSLWWTHTPEYAGERLGLIGHYAAYDVEEAQPLLPAVCEILAAHGCTLAVGPIDGNTFRHYRLLTERSVDGATRPPFLLEPDNPDWWPAHFAAQGFAPLAHYVSAHGPLPEHDPRLESLTARAAEHGITIRPADLDNFDGELRRIYPVVIRSFAQNFLFSPIDEAEFLLQYAPIRSYIHPQLVWLAERDGEVVGFMFAVPDLAQARRGRPVDTVILKTVAVLPELGGLGSGGLLVARCQTSAYALGYRHAIHALMVEDNVSRKISVRYATVFRRYTLFARKLKG